MSEVRHDRAAPRRAVGVRSAGTASAGSCARVETPAP
jgi:hypothetical protein